jgi:hypothetical protein
MTERRRNQYAGNCKVCGCEVKPGEGYLYSDTHSNHGRSAHRARGRWPKFVKCERCHTLGAAHKCDLPENKPAAVRRVSVNEVRKGLFRLSRYENDPGRRACVELVLPDGAAEPVAQRDLFSLSTNSTGPYYGDYRPCFGGRLMTTSAAAEFERLGDIAADMFEIQLIDPRDHE